MHFIRKEFIEFNNTLYYIVKIIREDDKPIIDAFKEYLQSDMVLKKEGKFYFLRSVPELEIIP